MLDSEIVREAVRTVVLGDLDERIAELRARQEAEGCEPTQWAIITVRLDELKRLRERWFGDDDEEVRK